MLEYQTQGTLKIFEIDDFGRLVDHIKQKFSMVVSQRDNHDQVESFEVYTYCGLYQHGSLISHLPYY